MANKDKEEFEANIAKMSEEDTKAFNDFISESGRQETEVGPKVTALEDGVAPRDAVPVPRESDAGDMIAASMAPVGDVGGLTTSALSAAHAVSEQFVNDEKTVKDLSEDFNTSKDAFSSNLAEVSDAAPVTSFVADAAFTGSIGANAFQKIAKAKNLGRLGRAGLAGSQGAVEGFARSKQPLSKEGMVNTLIGGALGSSIEGLTSIKTDKFNTRFASMTEETKQFALGVDNHTSKMQWDDFVSNREYDNVEGFVDTWINKKTTKGKSIFTKGQDASAMVTSLDTHTNKVYKSVRKSVGQMDIKISGQSAKEGVQDIINTLPKKTAGDKRVIAHYQEVLDAFTGTAEQIRDVDGATKYINTGFEKEVSFADVMDLANDIKKKAPSGKLNNKFNSFVEDTLEYADIDAESARKFGNVIKKSKELTDASFLRGFLKKRANKFSGDVISEMNRAIGYKSLVLAGGVAGLTGNKAGLLVGATMARALQSPKLPLHLAKSMDSIVKSVGKTPQHPMFREYVMTLLNKDDYRENADKDALSVLHSKVTFKNDPLSLTAESSKVRREPLIALMRDSVGDDAAAQLRDVLTNGSDDDIGRTMEQLVDQLPEFAKKEYIQESMGFDGKVFSPEKKAFFLKNIAETDAPLQWKLQAKKALKLGSSEGGAIPTSPQEFMMQQEELKIQQKKRSFIQGKQGPRY